MEHARTENSNKRLWVKPQESMQCPRTAKPFAWTFTYLLEIEEFTLSCFTSLPFFCLVSQVNPLAALNLKKQIRNKHQWPRKQYTCLTTSASSVTVLSLMLCVCWAAGLELPVAERCWVWQQQPVSDTLPHSHSWSYLERRPGLWCTHSRTEGGRGGCRNKDLVVSSGDMAQQVPQSEHFCHVSCPCSFSLSVFALCTEKVKVLHLKMEAGCGWYNSWTSGLGKWHSLTYTMTSSRRKKSKTNKQECTGSILNDYNSHNFHIYTSFTKMVVSRSTH